MKDSIIRAVGLSKKYFLRHEKAGRYTALRDVISGGVRSLGRLLRFGYNLRDAASRDAFWAIRDVSFEVSQGERVGVIGRNGAGKSTLLKILSRITEPTSGRLELEGRVASLLEVGTGFHPELTGRENVFLNGAILGMGRAEIRRKFDEIVAFAQVERFLDTPVKHFSSGMYVRLAFAVAAHLEPDILVVDEVLAVGDAEFQKKCIGKLESVSAEGRSILLVSHLMPTVLRLCDRAILLDAGRVIADGPSPAVVERYFSEGMEAAAERIWLDPTSAPGDSAARLRAVRVVDDTGSLALCVDIQKGCFIEIEYDYLTAAGGRKLTALFHLLNQGGSVVFSSADFNSEHWRRQVRSVGRVQARCRIPGNLLAEGRFSILVAICEYNPNVVHAIERDAITFNVVDRSEGDGVRGECAMPWPGEVRPMLRWEVTCDG